MQNDCIRIGWDEYGETVTDETNYFVGGKYVLNAFLNRMQLGDIVLSCYSARTIDAIGVITGDPEWLPNEDHYKRSRKVNWLLKGKKIDIEEFQLSRSLVQSTVYQLDTTAAEVIKVLEKNGFAPTTAVETKSYVFIIDEINRGNISKIFGELITLIEPSKRLGQSEGLQVRLPYSQKLFGIPDNVYLLGTMNTADRSIAMLDTALRRRFSFTEMMPDSGVLDGVEVEGISISGLITTLNRRIEVLFDREHTLGHAFFTPLRQSRSIQTLGEIFRDMGKEVPSDEEQAVLWLTRSAEQGNEYARYLLDHREEQRPPDVMLAVTRLLYHMSRIFQDNSLPKSRPGGIQIDRKRLRKLREKKIAQGHKPDDHEEQQPEMTM